MNHYEIKTEENYTKIIFHDERIVFTDIDTLFRETNIFFAKILKGMFIDVTFDFSKKYNRIIYTHTFLKTVCEHISSQVLNYRLYFYSNSLTKDKFRNTLLKKLKSIFGFKILEDVMDFSEIIEKIKINDCELIPRLEIFFQKDTKPKTFKHIKRYLEKTGLKDMGTHFTDVANKISLMY
jgi:hypothetical protein